MLAEHQSFPLGAFATIGRMSTMSSLTPPCAPEDFSDSYSRSHLDSVIRYIRNQEGRHAKRSFRNEYLTLLKRVR